MTYTQIVNAAVLVVALGAAAPLLAETPIDQQLLDDCRLEGRAAGMDGDALETYIKECVEDFAETEIKTNIELPPTGTAP